MDLQLLNHAPLVLGAHATTMLVTDYVNARLGSYGPGVVAVELVLLYPPRSRRPSANHLAAEVTRLAAASPRVTVRRAKRRVDVRAVCRGVSPRRIAGDDHLTPDELAAVTAAAAGALELMRPRLGPADRFDVAAFLADAQDALARCPGALRRYLR